MLFKEDNGEKLSHRIINSNRSPTTRPCGRNTCFPCQSGGTGRSHCWIKCVTYKVTCKPCLEAGKVAQYIGQSGRTIFSRGLEHERNLSNKTKGQPLSDHSRIRHPGRTLTTQDFKMEMTAQYKGALPRILSEGVQVEKLL